MRDLIQKLQRTVLGGPQRGSKDDAKQRLKILLIHDQVDLTQGQMEAMKQEILGIVAKYVEIDDTNVTFKLNRDEGEVALISTFPVRRVTGARA